MTGLIADIGATNARFALTANGGWRDERIFPCDDFPDFVAAARAYLDATLTPSEPRPTRAAACLPGPVEGDQVSVTNRPTWSFSRGETAAALGLEAFTVVNDFVANALAVPHLPAASLVRLDETQAPYTPGAPVAVLGPGTGLGVAVLLPGGREALATEGGHVTLAATTRREAQVIAALAEAFGHVSAERAVSGPGLVNLAAAVRRLAGLPAVRRLAGLPAVPNEQPADVMTDGINGRCPVRAEAVSLFFAFLGTVAGNLVLSTGAWGGVWLMGGILPRCVEPLKASPFVRRLAGKGRFQDRLEAVPRVLVAHPYPAFVGLAGLVDQP
ncbi:glucokinase [Pararhodospirillum photometricum]|nr:glucokinase [Pararhodospirillum photometricum]